MTMETESSAIKCPSCSREAEARVGSASGGGCDWGQRGRTQLRADGVWRGRSSCPALFTEGLQWMSDLEGVALCPGRCPEAEGGRGQP